MAPTLDTNKLAQDTHELRRRRDRSRSERRTSDTTYRRSNNNDTHSRSLRSNQKGYDFTQRYNRYPLRSTNGAADQKEWERDQSPPQRKSLRPRRYIPKPAQDERSTSEETSKTVKNWADINDSSNDDELWQLLNLDTKPSQGPVTRSKTPVKNMDMKPLASTPTSSAGKKDEDVLYQQFKKETVPLAEIETNASVFKTPSTSSRGRRRGRQPNSHGAALANGSAGIPSSSASSTPSSSSANQREMRSRNYFSSPVSSRSSSSRSSSFRSSSRNNSENKNGSTIDKKVENEMETDMEVLKRRQKTIDYGKNTIGYQNYITITPRAERKRGDPVTPDKFIKFSRRSWDAQVKNWRRKLHCFDPQSSFDADFENVEDVDVSDILSDLSFDSKLDDLNSIGCSSPVPSSSQLDDPLAMEGITSSEIGDLIFDNVVHGCVEPSSDLGHRSASGGTPIEYHFGLTEMEEADFLN